jgi:hypothetical protein
MMIAGRLSATFCVRGDSKFEVPGSKLLTFQSSACLARFVFRAFLAMGAAHEQTN